MISRVTMRIVNKAPSTEPAPGDVYTMPKREYWQLESGKLIVKELNVKKQGNPLFLAGLFVST